MSARSSVLLVDDEPAVLAATQRRMHAHRAEWELVTATSGAAAAELVEQRSFDVIVTDMRMPIVDGLELLARVAIARPSAVRIVLSGQTDFDAAVTSVSLSHRFLAKPCLPQMLIDTLRATRDALAPVTSPSVRSALARVTALPCSRGTAKRLGDLTARDVTEEEIAQVVASDAAIAAKIFQVAQSPFFGARSSSSNLDEALAALGGTIVRAVVMRALGGPIQESSEDPGAPLSYRLGMLLGAVAPETRGAAPAQLGDTLLALWGVTLR